MRQRSLVIAISVLALLLQACTQAAPEAASGGTSPAAQVATDTGSAFSEAQAADIRDQIARYWNVGTLVTEPAAMKEVVIIRAILASDDKVPRTEVQNDHADDKYFRRIKEVALRAILLASTFKLPAGVTLSSVI